MEEGTVHVLSTKQVLKQSPAVDDLEHALKCFPHKTLLPPRC